MLIAIDWDDTYIKNPELWFDFILSLGSNDSVILTSGRRSDEPVKLTDLPIGVPIVYCGRHYKSEVCTKAGHVVDVWIDTKPRVRYPTVLPVEG